MVLPAQLVLPAPVMPSAQVVLPAQVRHQATSLTSSYATWAYQRSVERFGPDGIELAVSRPSNGLCHANKCTNQNADVPLSCSCKTLKLPRLWPTLTRTQQLPRRA